MQLDLSRMQRMLALTLPLACTSLAAQQIPLHGDVTDSYVRPTAILSNGTYHGRYSVEYGQDFFLGVPFAQPPIGDLRFATPRSLNTSFTEPRNATAYGPECIGYGYDQWILGNRISEDCLTINIVRPSGTEESDDLPVAVWIHGGAFMNGGGLDPRYNLSYIVSESVRNGNPIIAASIQYRLSNWGWMFSRELAGVGAGNLGLRDQRLALHWVQENIGAFGGDATKVTIWGESAGAFSVGYHLVAYGGRDDGLFRSGILQSGSPAMKSTTVADWQPYFDAVVRKVGCAQTENVLDCLKRLPWTTLNDVFNSTTFSPRVPGIGAVLDGDIIVDQSSSLLRQGRFVRVPVLMGINTDEGASFAPRGINTEEQFLSFVRILGANATVLGQITKLYPDDPDLGLPATLSGRPEAAPLGLQWKRAVAFYGDVLFHSGRRLMAEVYAKAGVPVFSYRFNVLVNGAQPHQGSSHFKEVAFVFHNIHGNGYDLPGNAPNPFRGKGPEYTQLANIMSNMWSSFVATGDPNTSQNIAETQITDHESPSQKLEMAYDMLNHEAIAHKSKLKWPMYTLDTPVNIVFDVNVTDLTYIEADEFRKEAISLVNDVWHP